MASNTSALSEVTDEDISEVTDEDMEIARELLFFSKMCDYSIFQLKNRSEFMRVDYMDFKSQQHVKPTTSYPLTQPIASVYREHCTLSQPAQSWASNVVSQNLKISLADFYYCKREYTDLLMKNQKRDSQKILQQHHELCALALCGALRTDGSEREKWVEEYNALSVAT